MSRELSELLAEAEEEVAAEQVEPSIGGGRQQSCHPRCRLKAEEEGEVEAVAVEEEEEVAVEQVAAGIGGGRQPNPTVAFDGLSYEHVAAMLG